MFLLHALKRMVLLILLLFINPASTSGFEFDHLIKKICLNQFKNQMAINKTLPPKGMAEYTCNCFMDKINNDLSIDNAIKYCQVKASEKFFTNKAKKQ